MSKNKYVRYQLMANFGQIAQEYEKYREAFCDYQKCIKRGYPTTLLGFTLEGEVAVIFSH